jgi:lycopene cyclase CruA
MMRWVVSYLNFTIGAAIGWIFRWVPAFSDRVRPWLEPKLPGIWFWLLAKSYSLSYGMGKPRPFAFTLPKPKPSAIAQPIPDGVPEQG